MAETAAAADPKPKPKVERKEIEYAVFAAIGAKDADPDDLDFKLIGLYQATTPKGAKEAALADNPEFPGESVADRTDGPSGPKDLQSLVRGERLWLEAQSNWKPQLVVVEQPPPKFVGL